MNFLRKRLFVFYGMLLVFSGGVVGSAIAEKLVPPTRRARDAESMDVLSGGTTTAVAIAHVALIAFVIYLRLRPRESDVLGQPPRQWLMFTYGAYAIGMLLGGVMAMVMR